MHTQIFSFGLSFTIGIASVFAAPTISVQPMSQATMLGSNVTFAITASGSGPVTFQWLRNETSLVGKTNSSLLIVAASVSDEGDYNAIARDNSGSVTSQVARLQIVNGFTRVTNSGLPQTGQPLGAAWGDFNNDGWVDLFLATSIYSVYTNRGDGTLVSLTNRLFGDDSGGRRIGCAWGDYDNDGNLDLAIAPNANGSLYLFHNLGQGQQFARVVTNIFDGPGKQMLSTAWGDYDNDGFLDLFVPCSASGGSGSDLLFHNNGDGTFGKVASGVVVSDSVQSQSGIWGDYDNDGDPDLFATHLSNGRSALYRNESGTNFTKINAEPFTSEAGSAGGCVWADFDNDGDLDLFICNFSHPAVYYRNDGEGTFTKITNSILTLDGPSAGCTALDFDNDGWLDIVTPGPKNLLYHNNGDGTFTKVVNGAIVSLGPPNFGNNSFAVADVDRDGFQDLLWVNYAGASELFHNDGNSNAWLTVQCEGRLSNRAGIGTKVRVRATICGRPVEQLRHIDGGGLVFTQNEPVTHFGLGDETNAVKVNVQWSSGVVQQFNNVAPRQRITVVEPDLRLSPRSTDVAAGTTVTFFSSNTLPGPLTYQWLLNGVPLPNATNATLIISNTQTADAGRYVVSVTDSVAGMTAYSATGILSGPVIIQEQPSSVAVRVTSNATFRVVASGFGNLTYQWSRNGTNLSGTMNSLLTITNVQLSDEGVYLVRVSNSYGDVSSAPVSLTPLIRPVLTAQPVSVSIAAGGSVTLSASVSGYPPPFTFRWRQNGTVITNVFLNETNGFLTLTNVQAPPGTNSFRINVTVTNIAGPTATSIAATVTVLPDTDGDGIPDEWERAHGLSPTNALDALLDGDGDGMTNLAEYQSGSDSNDAQSFLRIGSIARVGDVTSIEFVARSNCTYTLESRPTLNQANWARLADVVAASTNRPVTVRDGTGSNHFYRLLAPRLP